MSTVTYPFDYYNSSVNTATYLTSSALDWGERSDAGALTPKSSEPQATWSDLNILPSSLRARWRSASAALRHEWGRAAGPQQIAAWPRRAGLAGPGPGPGDSGPSHSEVGVGARQYSARWPRRGAPRRPGSPPGYDGLQ